MRARRLLLLVAAGAAALAACFPAVTFLDDTALPDGGSEGGGSGGEEGGPGGTDARADDATGDAPDRPDAPANDSGLLDGQSDGSDLIKDAQADVPLPDKDAEPSCDVDRDGYKATGGSCGGQDCDDGDPRANPGVTQAQTFTPTAKTQGDWNCRDGAQKLHPYNVSCAAILTGCPAVRAGFTGNPGCGAQGEFVTCQPTGLNGCAVGSTRSEVQACL